MEVGESSGVARRKRTESNGGSSDSDLSDDWNFVDELDVNSHDVPSSDGESVEVIEADETQEHGTDGEAEAERTLLRQKGQLATMPESPTDNESPVSSDVETPPVREEMFDSSFCWFLLIATSAVLVSNLAFMAAEHTLDWNMEGNIDSPSFLRDLPITSKPSRQDSLPNVIPWADNEEVVVDTVEDTISVDQTDGKYVDRFDNAHNEVNNHKNSKAKLQKQSLKIDIHNIKKYFKVLNDITTSAEAQDKFAQALLILDALQVGLNDLEEVVTDSSELHHVLTKQKHKLQEVITEVEFGVSRTVEKLATNVLNKVHKLERKFENRWCKLEKNGHKEELKGLFYDCIESEVDSRRDIKKTKYFDGNKKLKKVENKRPEKKRMIMDDLHYAVDKDTNGKMYSKPSSWDKNNEDYRKFVKHERFENGIYIKKHKNEKSEKHGSKNKYSKDERDGKGKFTKKADKHHSKPENSEKLRSKIKYSKDERDGKGKFTKKADKHHSKPEKSEKLHSSIKYSKDERDGKGKFSKKADKHHSKPMKPTTNKPENIVYQTQNEKPNLDNSAEVRLSNYLKENCKKNEKNRQFIKYLSKYQEFRDTINDKFGIQKIIFDTLYDKYCKPIDDDNQFKNDLKGEFGGKKMYNVIDDQKEKIKNVVEVRIIETSKASNEANLFESEKHKVIPANKPRQWILSYEGSALDSKSNMSADWFFRAGESRSKARWSHHRGDWWFERSSHRRSHPHPPVWLVGRRKNWFFRRAWARHQCRQSPHDSWCILPQDETLTIPNPSPNLR